MRRIYQRILNEGDTHQAGEWLSYLFQQDSNLALQCVVDTLEAFMSNNRSIEAAVEGLQRLVKHVQENPKAKVWAYSRLVARTPEIAKFNWNAVVNFNRPLATFLADEFNSHSKSQEVAKSITSALTRNKENIATVQTLNNPKKRSIPDFGGKPPKKKLSESNASTEKFKPLK